MPGFFCPVCKNADAYATGYDAAFVCSAFVEMDFFLRCRDCGSTCTLRKTYDADDDQDGYLDIVPGDGRRRCRSGPGRSADTSATTRWARTRPWTS